MFCCFDHVIAEFFCFVLSCESSNCKILQWNRTEDFSGLFLPGSWPSVPAMHNLGLFQSWQKRVEQLMVCDCSRFTPPPPLLFLLLRTFLTFRVLNRLMSLEPLPLPALVLSIKTHSLRMTKQY